MVPDRHKLSPRHRQQALGAYLEGDLTVEQIGAEFGVSYRTIERIISEAGKSYSRQRRPKEH